MRLKMMKYYLKINYVKDLIFQELLLVDRKENKIPYLRVGNNIRHEYNKVFKSIER
jgi:hypothetical protein